LAQHSTLPLELSSSDSAFDRTLLRLASQLHQSISSASLPIPVDVHVPTSTCIALPSLSACSLRGQHHLLLYTTANTRVSNAHSNRSACAAAPPTSHCTATSPPAQPTTFRKPLHRSAPPYHSPATCATTCNGSPPAHPYHFRLFARANLFHRSLGHVSTHTDCPNDNPRLGWAWTPDVPHSRRRQTSARWTTPPAALELQKSRPT
jgi:hypothetical protein